MDESQLRTGANRTSTIPALIMLRTLQFTKASDAVVGGGTSQLCAIGIIPIKKRRRIYKEGFIKKINKETEMKE